MQRKRCHVIHPIGGVKATPLSRASVLWCKLIIAKHMQLIRSHIFMIYNCHANTKTEQNYGYVLEKITFVIARSVKRVRSPQIKQTIPCQYLFICAAKRLFYYLCNSHHNPIFLLCNNIMSLIDARFMAQDIGRMKKINLKCFQILTLHYRLHTFNTNLSVFISS